MGRALGCALLLLASCRTMKDDLNLLELESLRFKAENEEIRAEDLQARYAKRKERADRLAAELLALQHKKEEGYAEYDKLRADLAQLEKDRAAADRTRGETAAALQKLQGEKKRLDAELAKERAEIARLQAELDKAHAKHDALAADRKPAE